MSKEAHSEDHSGKALEGASEEEVYIDADEILQEAVDSNQVEDFDDLEVDDEGDEFQMVVEGDEDEDEDGEMEEGEERRADTSLCAFTAHSEPVFAVALHPTLPLAITGSQDDQAYIFNIKTGEKLLHLTDPAHGLAHTDSVIAVSFSADGMYAATGGMDGLVNVSELEYATEDVPAASEDQQQQQSGLSVKIKQTMSLQGPDEVNWIKWHPKGNVILVGSNDSTVWLFQLPSGQSMNVFAGHTGPVTCGEWTSDGKRFVTGAEDGTLILWDPRSSEPQAKLSSQNPKDNFILEGGVTTLAIHSNNNLILVGAADGQTKSVLFSQDPPKLECTPVQIPPHAESVEAIAFGELVEHAASGIAAVAAVDGRAFVLDLQNNMRVRHTTSHDDAITGLQFHPPPRSHIFTTASYDCKLRTWDARTGALLAEHQGHEGAINEFRIHSSGLIVSGGEDSAVLVFALPDQ